MIRPDIASTCIYLGSGNNDEFTVEMFQVSIGKGDYFCSYRLYNDGSDYIHVRKLPIPKREDYNSHDEWVLADSVDSSIYFYISEIIENAMNNRNSN